ncbi:uncharacterized protein C11orf24 homolog [Megalops cyprinoides]|uniref:uncharacterized protein C11orf24 homolog n=1 Tax=Megalops cyprinoides TaxID=118141 RepID=UPI0018656B68|nr:uncharacterized protein C11orf24 homolog [Megalops cyprinoides]
MTLRTLLALLPVLAVLAALCLSSHAGNTPRFTTIQTVNESMCASACEVSSMCNWTVFDSVNSTCYFLECPNITICQSINVEALLKKQEADVSTDPEPVTPALSTSTPHMPVPETTSTPQPASLVPANTSDNGTLKAAGSTNADRKLNDSLTLNGTIGDDLGQGTPVVNQTQNQSSVIIPTATPKAKEPVSPQSSSMVPSVAVAATTHPAPTTATATTLHTTKSTSTTTSTTTTTTTQRQPIPTTARTPPRTTTITTTTSPATSTVTTTTASTTPITEIVTTTTSTTAVVKEASPPTTKKATSTQGPSGNVPQAGTTTSKAGTGEEGGTNNAGIDIAAGPLTRQLVDTSSLLAVFLFGLIFFLVTVALFLRKAYDSYKKRDYTQVDYLINGMYSDSGV